RERSKLVTRMRGWMAGDIEHAPRYPNLRAHPFNYPSRPSRSPLSVGELPSLGVLSHPRKRQESPKCHGRHVNGLSCLVVDAEIQRDLTCTARSRMDNPHTQAVGWWRCGRCQAKPG